MLRTAGIAIVLLFATLGLSACQRDRSTREAQEVPSEATAKSRCFRVGYLDITASAPLFIAQDLGLFEEANVCIIEQKFSTSNQLVDALAANRLDYVVESSAVPALALQYQDPGRFRITAASRISQENPFDAILVRAGSGIDELEDLEGKSIGVFPGTTASALLQDFLIEKGVDTDRVDFIQVPPPDQVAALKAGRIDAAHLYEPGWTIGRQDPDLVELHGTVYGEQLQPNPQGISILNASALDADAAGVCRLVRAFDRAVLQLVSGPNQTRRILRKHFELPGSTPEDMKLLIMDPHDKIDWQAMRAYVDLLVRVGELPGEPTLDGLQVDCDEVEQGSDGDSISAH